MNEIKSKLADNERTAMNKIETILNNGMYDDNDI
jgi:hypothetical protein